MVSDTGLKLIMLLAIFLDGTEVDLLQGRLQQAQRFEPVLSHIDEHLDQPIELEDLAALVHLHPTYFANEFSRRFNVPPRRYVNQKRMERAQHLLHASAQPLQRIAAQVGYEDVYYFQRVFKKFVGVSPGAYRRMRLAE